MTFAGFWRQVHASSVSSNSLPTYFRFTCLFHSHNVLVKSFTVFVIDFAEIFWGKNPSVTSESGFADSYCIP